MPYEYHAIGARARVCTGCSVRRERTWLTHYVFGEHARDGLPFGSTLGGYGARHRLRWSAWSPSARWTVSAEGAGEVRGGGNLLAGCWPGKRRGMSVHAAYRPSGSIRFEVGSGIAGGPEFPTAAMLELTGTVSSGRGREWRLWNRAGSRTRTSGRDCPLLGQTHPGSGQKRPPGASTAFI